MQAVLFAPWLVKGAVYRGGLCLRVAMVTLARDRAEALERCQLAVRDGAVAGRPDLVTAFQKALAGERDTDDWIDVDPVDLIVQCGHVWSNYANLGELLRTGQVWGSMITDLPQEMIRLCGIAVFQATIASQRALREAGVQVSYHPSEAPVPAGDDIWRQSFAVVAPGATLRAVDEQVRAIVEEGLEDQRRNVWLNRTIRAALEHRLYRLDMIAPGQTFAGSLQQTDWRVRVESWPDYPVNTLQPDWSQSGASQKGSSMR